MPKVSVALLAVILEFAVGCSSSSDDSAPSEPTAGSSGRGGSTGTAGATGQSGTGTVGGGTAMMSGGSGNGNGGHPTGGTTAGGASGSNSSGASGRSSGGASSEAGAGGRPNGAGGRPNGAGGRPSGGAAGMSSGAAGASCGSGGTGACVQNLACKLSPPASTGDIYQDCVDRINQFLTQCACLPALTRRKDGEACADQMAEYDASMNSAHAGAIAQICTPGGSQNECPGYSSNTQVIGLCMQQMWDEGPPPTDPCNGSCYEDHGHFINMTDKDVTKVACGFYTTASGKVWATQNFSH